jgi:hypothetical protein
MIVLLRFRLLINLGVAGELEFKPPMYRDRAFAAIDNGVFFVILYGNIKRLR